MAKITTLLAVYLVWIFGSSVVALSCMAENWAAGRTHCCSMHCECHHEGCEHAHFEEPHNCHHDHSNRIALYDFVERNDLVKPAILHTSVQVNDHTRIEEISTIRSSRHYERHTPIPLSPTLSRRGLRAPPVVA